MFLRFCWVFCLMVILGGCATNDVQLSNNPKGSFEKKPAIVQKSVTEKKENAIFSKLSESSHSLGSITDLVVDYSGKYKVSEIDMYLIKNYQKRYTYRTFTKDKYNYTVPTYDYLNIYRSGPGWKVNIIENKVGDFSIKGKNSTGENLDTFCKILEKCFNLL